MAKICILGLCWITTAALGCASRDGSRQPATPSLLRAAAVRYQVTDAERAAEFYVEHLGFRVAQQHGAAFAAITNGCYTLWLSGPASSGARPLPDGRKQAPGGWNRVVLEVADLDAIVARLRQAGLRFRNEIEEGPGGRQIQIEDPDGNPIEIFERAQ